MKIAHLMRSVYHGMLSSFIGSIAMITQEISMYQRINGHTVDILGENDFLKGDVPFSDKLRKYDIVHCYESDWEKYLLSLNDVRYVLMNYDTLCRNKNHITISNYWKNKSGGRPKVVYVGITPERTFFSDKKTDKIIYINTLAKKKCCYEILKNIYDLGPIEIMGGKLEEDHYRDIMNFISEHPNITYRGFTSEFEKWDSLKKAKCVVMAHNPKFGEESGCIVQIEAKFAGTPAIAMGDIFEMINHNKTGFVANNWEEFRKYINISNEISPKDCLQDGLERFHAADRFKDYIKLYEEVINNGGW